MPALGHRVIALGHASVDRDGTGRVANVSEGKVSVTPNVAAFFHEGTYTITYVVSEQEGDHCAIIDSVLDYDLKSGRTSTAAADSLIDFVRERGFTLDWILDTYGSVLI